MISRFSGITLFIRKNLSWDRILFNLTFVIMGRMFLEEILEHGHSFFQPWDSYNDLAAYIHVFISWICIFFTITIPVKLCLRLSYRESILFTLLFYPIILIVPIIDFIATGGEGAHIVYAQDSSLFLRYFLNGLNPFARLELITHGVRVEIFVVTIGSFFIGLLHFRQGLLRSTLLALTIYTVIFFYAFLLPVAEMIGFNTENIHTLSATELLYSQNICFLYIYAFLALLVIIGFISYREDRAYFKAAASFAFPSRSTWYLFFLAFGFLFAAKEGGIYGKLHNWADISKLLTAMVSIFFLFVYAKIINDREDLEIDRVSNRTRPLAMGIIKMAEASAFKNICLCTSFVAAMMASKIFIACWLFLWSASYLYSMPPFRIRKYYPAGHILLAAIGTAVFLAGAMLALGDGAYNKIVSKEIFAYIFLSYFFLSHIKDFKDTEGDKRQGVANLLNIVPYPKFVGITAVLGFSFFVWLIACLLHLNAITGVISFAAAASVYVATAKDMTRIDRVIPFSLLLMAGLSTAWFFRDGIP